VRSVVLNFKTGEIDVHDVPSPIVGPRRLLVANHNSLISAGTEGYIIDMARKGPVGKALDRPDLAMQVINKALVEGFWGTAKVVRNLISQPLPLGYSCAGEILETGAQCDPFQVGDRVACAGLGMANHAEHVAIPITMAAKLPENVSTEEAAFGTLGAIALHGVRLSEPQIGSRFVVIGLGLIGQLTTQILAASGCRVIGFDIDPEKVALAKENGIYAGGVIGVDDPVEITQGVTGGRGADGVVIAAHSSDNAPLTLATELAREKAVVTALGLVKLDVPRRAFFEKELRLEVSRAYGAGAYDADYERKGRDYPAGYVRWTQGRNLEAFIDLLSAGKVDVNSLISHRFALDDASDAYAKIRDRDSATVGVLFEYETLTERTRTIQIRTAKPTDDAPKHENPRNFGVIGAGKFAQGVLLPALVAQKDVKILAVATANGLTAEHVASKYKSEVATSDWREVVGRQDIGSVLIATRHDMHAELICAAAKAGKNIFVEKPLAVSFEELADVERALEPYAGVLAVGFNRPHAPLSLKFKGLLKSRRLPLDVHYRFLAPRIRKGHESDWVHDPESGGSRIVGEVCHMVDLVGFLVGSRVKSVFAVSINGDAPDIPNYDTLNIVLTYEDGSTAHLGYVANSDASVPQERIELHWEGAYGLIDNFRSGRFKRGRSRKSFRGLSQDKGWRQGIQAFVRNIDAGGQTSDDRQSLIDTTRVTLLIHKSLETGLRFDLAGNEFSGTANRAPD